MMQTGFLVKGSREWVHGLLEGHTAHPLLTVTEAGEPDDDHCCVWVEGRLKRAPVVLNGFAVTRVLLRQEVPLTGPALLYDAGSRQIKGASALVTDAKPVPPPNQFFGEVVSHWGPEVKMVQHVLVNGQTLEAANCLLELIHAGEAPTKTNPWVALVGWLKYWLRRPFYRG